MGVGEEVHTAAQWTQRTRRGFEQNSRKDAEARREVREFCYCFSHTPAIYASVRG
jgi:hypothetical protein